VNKLGTKPWRREEVIFYRCHRQGRQLENPSLNIFFLFFISLFSREREGEANQNREVLGSFWFLFFILILPGGAVIE
jgi:hypothetical protein